MRSVGPRFGNPMRPLTTANSPRRGWPRTKTNDATTNVANDEPSSPTDDDDAENIRTKQHATSVSRAAPPSCIKNFRRNLPIPFSKLW